MKKTIFLILCVSAILLACKKESIATDTDESKDTDTTVHENPDDYTWDSTKVATILLADNNITVNPSVATVSGNTVTITSAGTYSINGTLTNGQVIVNTEDEGKVVLILNGVNITNSTSAPIYIEKAEKVIVDLADSTENTLVDATTYVYPSTDVDEPNAALYSKADLTIYGKGILNVKGNYQDGITSKDGLLIKSGTITVNSKDDGIRGKDYLIVDAGNITITSGGDGLKSDNEADAALGYINIASGKFTITSATDAIAAQTKVLITSGNFNIISGGGSSKTAGTLSTKGIKGLTNVTIEDGTFSINTADDAIHSNNEVTINKGTFAISAADDGLHADSKITINNGSIAISKSVEAIESASITVNGGDVNLTASNDGFNATKGLVAGGTESNDGSSLTINAGTITLNVTNGDGLDSNGNIVIAGGTIVVNGPQSQPEVGMDYNGTCNISGGFLIISGPSSNMTQGPSTTSTQYSLKLSMTTQLAANTLFHIQDAIGNDIVTFKPLRNYSTIVFSSPGLKNGSTYSIYTGGSSTGTLVNGIYTGGTYTAGTLYSNFTISSIVTSIGTSTGPGGRP